MYKLTIIHLGLFAFVFTTFVYQSPIQATLTKKFTSIEACGCNQRGNNYRKPRPPGQTQNQDNPTEVNP